MTYSLSNLLMHVIMDFHFSTYVLVKADEAIITAPSTGFDSSASVLMGIIFLAGSVAGVLRKRRYITK